MASLHTNTNLTDENGNVLNPITEEERQYAMHKLVTGTMPEGHDIYSCCCDIRVHISAGDCNPIES
ncbi:MULTISPECIES: hypothetical protein [unclassified Brenneria]|uniref:hypothetical protein n=1 Tax=unclassified Brenneria TaxID=2634434 RepID=UPI001C12E8D2|nr:hypothetical protein [Brenneria sp. hezel4-2-4]MEE3651333.1 hypothetical protein [Brenneria sp. HEZEL_4_2_4]